MAATAPASGVRPPRGARCHSGFPRAAPLPARRLRSELDWVSGPGGRFVGLRGEGGKLSREIPASVVYEARPQPKDHKVGVDKGAPSLLR